MADIKFVAFIEKELTNSRGEQFGFTAAETHRKKQDDGTYKTVARTFHSVKGASTIGFRKGQRVTVNGRQVTDPWLRDGETRYSLTVWADTVELAETRPTADVAPPPEDPGEPSWDVATIPDDTPW